MNWPRYPADRLAQARAAAQSGRVVLQESFCRGMAGWLLGPDSSTLATAAKSAGIASFVSRHPGDGRGCIELYGDELGRAYSRAGPQEKRPASWSLFTSSQELDAVKHALDGGVAVWVDSSSEAPRWLLLGSTEGMVRQARDTVKARGTVAQRPPAWATLLDRASFDRARSRCLSEASLSLARAGTLGVVAPVRRPVLAFEASGPLVLERLRQAVAAYLQRGRPEIISLPVTAWTVSVVLGMSFSSNMMEGVRFRLHLPGPWSDHGRTWVDQDLRDDYSFFTGYICADPLATLAMAMDLGPANGFEISEHGGYEDAVSAATQEVESLLVAGQKEPHPFLLSDGVCLSSFAWRKAAAAEREWVELADLAKATG